MDSITVDGLPINYKAGNLLPEHMQGGMKRYIEHRIPPGGFLTAVLSNDLIAAAAKADGINKHFLFEYAIWLQNYAPQACYGSHEKVSTWLSDS